MMKTSHGTVVKMNYTLSLGKEETLESTDCPIEYLHGFENIIPGLERALEGAEPGDRRSVVLEPADAYGDHDPERFITVPVDEVPDGATLEPGMKLMADSGRGPVPLTVSQVNEDTVVFDANHPLAGKTLHFDVEVVDVRAAEMHELGQGYPGPRARPAFS
ncbi:MAG: peptidylprolyl isomerase [Thermoleophilia bacterium]|nr:peptidylprolyl isomerase [Thermoleophilia bacterium]